LCFFISFCNLCNNRIKTSAKRKASCKYKLQKHEKYCLVSQLSIVINRHFPDLLEQLNQLPDYRKRPHYKVKELIVSGLLVFLFKQGSRNQADNTAKNIDYQDNIKRFFGVKVADNDTVDLFLRKLNPSDLEEIKQNMFRKIVKSKLLQKEKLFGEYYLLAIDGTGLQSFDYEPFNGCPFKKYKTGKKVWTTYVLEAKIVTSNGFALSLATEWIENINDENFDKQDSEIKAFKRLAEKIKKNFPRLPLTLLLDGLYPNNPVFNICKNYNWRHIITLKDKSLKSVQEQIADQLLFKEYQTEQKIEPNSTHWISNDYKIFESVEYKGHKLYVFETLKEEKHKKTNDIEKTRFVHITDIEINKKNIHTVSKSGRMRWKIENEGFNNQKNNEYEAQHKYSRTNFNSSKNYYELLQIADILNQFTYKTKYMSGLTMQYGLTIKALLHKVFEYLTSFDFDDNVIIDSILNVKTQLRY